MIQGDVMKIFSRNKIRDAVSFFPALMGSMLLFMTNMAYGQSPGMIVSGSPCVGSYMVFRQPNCSGGWSIANANSGTHYRIESTDYDQGTFTASMKITWLKAVNNVQVSACGHYSDLFNVVEIGPTPEISLTANTTTVCSNSSETVTFTAHPVNVGTYPNYKWYVNGGLVSEGNAATTFSRVASGFSNGDEVKVILFSTVACYGVTAPNSSIVMNVKSAPSVNAGSDQDATLPLASVTLTGAVSYNDGAIGSTTWSKTSGPAVTLSGTNTAVLTLTDLLPGTYVFRLQAKDNCNATSYDEVKVIAHYPPNNWNYVREENILVPGVTAADAVPGLTVGMRTEKTTYIDGVGRPAQVVDWQQSPQGLDMIQPVGYDGLGREYRKYLPFTSGTSGWYRADDAFIDAANNYTYKGDAAAFYSGNSAVAGDVRPFAETIFEPSPLNRPATEYGPGQAWSTDGDDKPTRINYQTNVFGTGGQQERIIAFKIDDTGRLVLRDALSGYVESGGYYSTGRLTVKQITDEQNHIVREYSNTSGQVILKRVQVVSENPALNNDAHWAETYYVYNEFGELTVVLSPEAVKSVKSALIQH